MTKRVYKFELREDMPPGFIRNKDYPELSAMTRFLKQYHGKKFLSPKEFEKILEKFPKYLEKHKIKKSENEEQSREMRKGLFIWPSGPSKRYKRYVVYCNALQRGSSHECQFGLLEKIII